jgi:hypothetical protein
MVLQHGQGSMTLVIIVRMTPDQKNGLSGPLLDRLLRLSY